MNDCIIKLCVKYLFSGFFSKTFYINFYNRMFKILFLNLDLSQHSFCFYYVYEIKLKSLLYFIVDEFWIECKKFFLIINLVFETNSFDIKKLNFIYDVSGA